MCTPNGDPSQYRPAVGIAVFNGDGKVWLGKRYRARGTKVWQMPQGGIDAGEATEIAAARELWEETGITLDKVIPIGEIEDWLYYDFPEKYKGRKATKGWLGQKQKWYAFRFHGKAKHMNLKTHGEQEFSKWRWSDLSETPNLIVPFKRDVYARIASEFERFARPVK